MQALMRATAVLVSALLIAAAETAQALEPGPIPQWIWNSGEFAVARAVRLERTFTLTAGVKSATLWALADDRVEVKLNSSPAWPFVGTRRIQPVDVTQQLQRGENVLTAVGTNESGPAGIAVLLKIVDDEGRILVITSDPTWSVVDASGRSPATSLGLLGVFPWGNPEGETEDYYQWKKALGTGQAHDAASIAVLPGFEVELVRSSRPGEGSWVSLTFDPRGRAIVGREGKGLLRYTLPPLDSMEVINDTLEECRGVLSAGRSLFANANNSKGLYRLRDTNGDDQFDEVRLLKQTAGGVGHGRNALALGPDGMIYTIHGNNVRLPDDFTPGRSPLQHFAEDKLLPVDWDRFLFDADARVPAGHVARIDPEGDHWELVAGGFRNPYGIDFNADGEMFTFDADNEGDIGTPWYRPTRINHIVPGGDYGFRQGTANRHAWFAEHPPANIDIGLGSPTGVRFGTHTNFPDRYRKALYALDWSYGRIYAVHLVPRGASYVCQVEKLLEGSPLNVTDLAVGLDGALYFVTGGRGTQSGLYRVRWVGRDPLPFVGSASDTASEEAGHSARVTRRQLESFHGQVAPEAVDLAWGQLDSSDPWLRHAARVALEFQPVESWSGRILSAPPDSQRHLAGLLALARVGDSRQQPGILEKLGRERFAPLVWQASTDAMRLEALRVLAVCVMRQGRPDAPECAAWCARLEPLFPGTDPGAATPLRRLIDQRLCELLVYFGSETVVPVTLPLVEQADSPEERLRYLFLLRSARAGWNPGRRRTFMELLKSLDYHVGGNLLPVALDALRNEVLGTLSDGERRDLELMFARDDSEAAEAAAALQARPVVKKWTRDDLADLLATPGAPDFESGATLFRQALCIRCHRLAGAGGAVGPELGKVAHRFGPQDLLDMIVDPSRVIDEKYRQTQIETQEGKIVVGRLVGGDDKSVVLSTDPLAPRQTMRVPRESIASQTMSTTSPMPAGLLDTLTAREIRDLLAYLRAGGSRTHAIYQGP